MITSGEQGYKVSQGDRLSQINQSRITENVDMHLILSTISMLKNSKLKNYLFDFSRRINKMMFQFHSSEETELTIIEYATIILENMDAWVRQYNSEMRMTMKKELASNLVQMKKNVTRYY